LSEATSRTVLRRSLGGELLGMAQARPAPRQVRRSSRIERNGARVVYGGERRKTDRTRSVVSCLTARFDGAKAAADIASAAVARCATVGL